MHYQTPANTQIGHVHLKVTDIPKALVFYEQLLGFTITQRMGNQAVFLSAGNYHHHIALNTWHSLNSSTAPVRAAGLYHAAILYPTRKALAAILKRLIDHSYPITGAADHGVSEAIYLNDPDQNGIELYWDKPRALWPYNNNGHLQMVSDPLDVESLLAELNN